MKERHLSRTLILVGTAVASIALTGCPLSDRYSIEEKTASGGGESSAEGGKSMGGRRSQSSAAGDSGSEGGSSGTSASSSATTATPSCDATQCDKTCCGQTCTDVTSDAANCGACDNACPTGRTCVARSCVGWTSMAAPPSNFVARQKFASTEMGGRWFIFGGLDAAGNVLNDGAIYEPASDSWTVISANTGSPSGRQLASAVWTGLRVLVVGGTDAASSRALADGAKYDPETNSWLALPDLPVGRVEPLLANLSSGQVVVSWGGYSASGTPQSGGERYPYSATSWTSLQNGFGGPGRLSDVAFASGTSQVWIYGGLSDGTSKSSAGYYLTTSNYSWSQLTSTGTPAARYAAFGAWDGNTTFFIWGGRDESKVFAEGSRFSLGAWTALGTTGAPSARFAPHRRTGFTFALGTEDYLVLGGVGADGALLTDGGRYNGSTGSWTKVEGWLSSATHEFGAAVRIGGEVFVWGGRDGLGLTTKGERLRPP